MFLLYITNDMLSKKSVHSLTSLQSLSRVWLFATPCVAARQAYLSITIPRVHPNSCPSSQWWHWSISYSVVLFFFCSQSFPASEIFIFSQLFSWGGQSIGISGLASILPMNTQDWSPLGCIAWTSLQSKGHSGTPEFKSINSSALSFLHSQTHTSIHDHWKI